MSGSGAAFRRWRPASLRASVSLLPLGRTSPPASSKGEI